MGVIICDRCGHEQGFNPHLTRMKTGVERVYITCENCKAQYTAYYTDSQIRALQARQRKIQNRIKGKKAEEYRALYEEYQNNKQKLAIMMFELRQQMEAGAPGAKVTGKKVKPGNRWGDSIPTMHE